MAEIGGGQIPSLPIVSATERSGTMGGREEWQELRSPRATSPWWDLRVDWRPYRWKDSVQNDEEIRMWVADFIANGLRPWYTKFAATIDDRRWLGVVEDIYNWAYEVEPYLRNTRPVADVAMVFSQQTAAYYGGPKAQQKVEDHILGCTI